MPRECIRCAALISSLNMGVCLRAAAEGGVEPEMSDCDTMQGLRERIWRRFKSEPVIRVNVSLSRPKLRLENVEARIVGVYAHIFQVEEMSGEHKRHTLQYADVLLGDVEIIDLE